MKFRRSRQEPVSLNLTPLIDVVFLLLIFFMVSTTFEKPSELKLQLPETVNGGAAQASPYLLRIAIKENGELLMDGNPVQDLAVELEDYLEANGEPDQVRILADERALHRDVSAVLDALVGADLTDMSFQTLATRVRDN